MKKIKIITILFIFFLLSVQIISNAYEGYVQKGSFLFKEKMSALRMQSLLAEREGNKQQFEIQQKLLAKACEDTLKTPFLDDKLYIKAKRMLAETKIEQNSHEEALNICDEILIKNPDDKETLKVKAKVFWAWSKDCISKTDYDEAIDNYQTIIDMNISPELSAFYKSLIAEALIKKGNIEEGIKWYQKIMDEHSDLINWVGCALYFMGEAYSKQKNTAEAINCYQKLINDYPKSAWIKQAEIRLNQLQQKEGE